MKPSSSQLVRSFLNAIHPPLPKSARESKKLVGVLESAFQKHLDDVHPSPKSLNAKDSSTVPDPAHQITLDTHRHLASLLAHPLLAQRQPITAKPQSLTAAAVLNSDQVGFWKVHDFDLVQKCCRLYLLGLKRKEIVPPASRLGPRLMNWYTQMTPSDKCNFLMDSETLSLVVPVMYVDGLESEVWNWLRTLYESSFGKSVSASKLAGSPEKSLSKIRDVKAEDHLISLMISQSVLKGSLSDAAQQFVQAAQYQKSRVLDPTMEQSSRAHLGRSWHRLASAILRARRHHQLPNDLYQDVLRCSAKNQQFWTWDSACLEVYHPESPSAAALLKIVRNDQFSQRILLWGSAGNPPQILHTVLLDAAELCQSQDLLSESRQFLRIACSTFPDPKYSTIQSKDGPRKAQTDLAADLISDFDFVPA